MKIKEQTPIENFTNLVSEQGEKLLSDDMGYLLFTYNQVDKGSQENVFGAKGKLPNMAECLLSGMKSNEALAHVVCAAANAYGQMRMIAAQQAIEEKKEEKKPKIVS